jgi:hypothetical protein
MISPLRLRIRLALVILALTGACVVLTEPAFPVDAVRISAPARFAAWWKVTEACSGLSGDFASVGWYVVPTTRVTVAGYEFDGYTWEEGGSRIVLAQPMLTEGSLVRHEMLHALLQQRGGHPGAFFRDRCGDIVVCGPQCSEEAGTFRQPTHGDSILDPAALTRGASITPSIVSLSRDSGWMTIVVAARNDRPYPVWVRLAPNPKMNAGSFEQFWIESPAFGYVGEDNGYEFMPFGPRQTRRMVVDEQAYVPGWRNLEVGRHTFTAGFSGARTQPVSIEVVP